MKKFVRALGVLLAAGLIAGSFAGCSGGDDGKTITLLNTKGEIQADFEELADRYKELTGVTVEITAAPAGSSPFATISSMYNSGNPPTMAMLDTADIVALYQEKALDLSDEAWAKDEGGQLYRIDGKVYSFPMGVEGKGLIYNKTVLEQTLGRTFDPAEYNTYDKFKALLEELKSKGMAAPVALSKEDIHVDVLEVKKAAKKLVDLIGADVVVSVGRGISKDVEGGIKIAEDLAEALGGVVGASRAVVDAGWMSADHQVGQTGKTVHPKIYVALGISGAIQHKAGMQDSECIIAVNKNESAPIFDVASYGIVGDLFKVGPMLVDAIKALKASK